MAVLHYTIDSIHHLIKLTDRIFSNYQGWLVTCMPFLHISKLGHHYDLLPIRHCVIYSKPMVITGTNCRKFISMAYVPDCSISIALAMEIQQYGTKPSICCHSISVVNYHRVVYLEYEATRKKPSAHLRQSQRVFERLSICFTTVRIIIIGFS